MNAIETKPAGRVASAGQLRALIKRLNETRTQRGELASKIRSVRAEGLDICRDHADYGKGPSADEDFEKFAARAGIKGRDGNRLNALLEAYKSFIEKINSLDEKKDIVEQIRLIMREAGGQRNNQLLAAHSELIESLSQSLLRHGITDDAEEASDVARSLNAPTRLHQRIDGWRSSDLLSGAIALANELEAEIPLHNPKKGK